MKPLDVARRFAPGWLKSSTRTARDFVARVALRQSRWRHAEGFAGNVLRAIADRAAAPGVGALVVDTTRFPDGQQNGFGPRHQLQVVEFLVNQAPAINRSAALFADDRSAPLLAEILTYRALGPRHRTLPRAAGLRDRIRTARNYRVSAKGSFPPFELFEFDVPFSGELIRLEAWDANILNTFVERQYYLHRDGAVVAPSVGDIVIDAGACFGDTALAFAASVGSTGTIHSFEPMPRQRALFKANLQRNSGLASRITVNDSALSDRTGDTIRFTDGGASARQSHEGAVEVSTLTIDDYVARSQLPRVDFVKMDIEGAETAALRGAVATLKRHRPKLAISVYHSLGDLIGIPAFVADLGLGYRLHLEHHTNHAEETVLYAVAP